MAKSQANETDIPAPNLLIHLEQAWGWTEGRALDALGAYLLSTKAAKRLRRQREPCHRPRRAA